MNTFQYLRVSTFLLFAILVPILVACGSSGDTFDTSPTPTPVPGTTSIANGFQMDVVEIITGTQAIELAKRNNLRKGWQVVFMYLSPKNIGVQLQRMPKICGSLIDTGDYPRELLWAALDPGKFGSLLLPQARTVSKLVVAVEIPENQEVKTLTLYPAANTIQGYPTCETPGGSNWVFDLQAPLANVGIPYDTDTIPVLAPTNEKNILEYEVSDSYKISISNFRFKPNKYDEDQIRITAKITAENMGGYDLSLSDENLGVIAIDNEGWTWTGEIYGGIAPGLVERLELTMSSPFEGEPSSKWVQVVLFNNRGQLLSQVVWNNPN